MRKTNKTIEGVMKKINEMNKDPKRKTKICIPDDFNYVDARKFFKEPLVTDAKTLEVGIFMLINQLINQSINQLLERV